MTDLQARVRERVREEALRHGASTALADPAIFAEVDALLRQAVDRSRPGALLMPEFLGEPERWRLETALRYQSHRGGMAANLIMFVCVQELAIETARLRQELNQPPRSR